MHLSDALIAWINQAQRVFVAIVAPLLDFIDARHVVRRVAFAVVLYLLVDCYVWAKAYAMRDGMTGAELGMVIAAVLVPVTALQASVLRLYNQSREGGDGAST